MYRFDKFTAIFCILLIAGAGFAAEEKIPPRTNVELDYIGVAAKKQGYHVWGSSPVIGPDGRVHLYVAEWPIADYPKFTGWYNGSRIAHYVSDSPEGPFEFVRIAVKDRDGAFNAPHNPTISYIDGKYVLCFIVNENNQLSKQRIIMYIADELDDNWRPAAGAEPDGTILRKPSDPNIWNHNAILGVSNPSLLKHKGKYKLYFKSVIPTNEIPRYFGYGISTSEALEGPYQIQPEMITELGQQLEDACVFTYRDNVFMFSRNMGGRKNLSSGLLWQSNDGWLFKGDNIVKGFGKLIDYVGQSALKNRKTYRGPSTGHLERPQLLFKNGTPKYLYLATGVSPEEGFGSCSHVFKIEWKK